MTMSKFCECFIISVKFWVSYLVPLDFHYLNFVKLKIPRIEFKQLLVDQSERLKCYSTIFWFDY